MKMTDLLRETVAGSMCEDRIFLARSMIVACRLALTNDQIVINEDTKQRSIETVMELAVELLSQAEEDAEDLGRVAAGRENFQIVA